MLYTVLSLSGRVMGDKVKSYGNRNAIFLVCIALKLIQGAREIIFECDIQFIARTEYSYGDD